MSKSTLYKYVFNIFINIYENINVIILFGNYMSVSGVVFLSKYDDVDS